MTAGARRIFPCRALKTDDLWSFRINCDTANDVTVAKSCTDKNRLENLWSRLRLHLPLLMA